MNTTVHMDLATVAELAAMLGISGVAVRRLCWHLHCAYRNVEGRRFYGRQDVLDAIASTAGAELQPRLAREAGGR